MLTGADKVLCRVKGRAFHDSRECGPVYFGRGASTYEGATADFVMPDALAKRQTGIQRKEHRDPCF